MELAQPFYAGSVASPFGGPVVAAPYGTQFGAPQFGAPFGAPFMAPPLEAFPFGTPGFAPFAPPFEPGVGIGPGDAAIFEEREDYLAELWAFSRFALPWLLFTLLLLGVVIGLTFWQQTGDIKNRFDGVPRRLIAEIDDENDTTNGQTTEVRNLRIAAFTVLIASSIFGFLLFFARPGPKIRTALGFLIGLLLILGGVLAWIAFGISLDKVHDSRRCPVDYRFTRARCSSREGLSLGQIALDAGMGAFGVLAGILLAINAKKGHWRMAPRDWTEEQRDRELEPVKERQPGEMIHKNVSFVRKWLVAICLLACLGFGIGSLILLWIRESDRQEENVRGPRGRAFRDLNGGHMGPFEEQGWPTVNTAIRLTGCVTGIIIILLNLMPFRSRAAVMIFGFCYLAAAVVLYISFAFDVQDLNDASGFTCPTTFDGLAINCENHRYVATAVLEFIAAFSLTVYVIVEYIIKRGRPKLGPESVEAAYGVFAFSKTEVRVPQAAKSVAPFTEATATMPCSMCTADVAAADLQEHVQNCAARPVPCDACGETYRAHDFNNHRAVCGEMLVSCTMCDDELHRFRLQNHQESECPKRMVLCDQCGDAFQHFRLDRHRRAECACRSE